ncbi:MAG: hypothetical protein ACSHXK_17025 [Oceanococcus sp.]
MGSQNSFNQQTRHDTSLKVATILNSLAKMDMSLNLKNSLLLKATLPLDYAPTVAIPRHGADWYGFASQSRTIDATTFFPHAVFEGVYKRVADTFGLTPQEHQALQNIVTEYVTTQACTPYRIDLRAPWAIDVVNTRALVSPTAVFVAREQGSISVVKFEHPPTVRNLFTETACLEKHSFLDNPLSINALLRPATNTAEDATRFLCRLWGFDTAVQSALISELRRCLHTCAFLVTEIVEEFFSQSWRHSHNTNCASV